MEVFHRLHSMLRPCPTSGLSRFHGTGIRSQLCQTLVPGQQRDLQCLLGSLMYCTLCVCIQLDSRTFHTLLSYAFYSCRVGFERVLYTCQNPWPNQKPTTQHWLGSRSNWSFVAESLRRYLFWHQQLVGNISVLPNSLSFSRQSLAGWNASSSHARWYIWITSTL